MKYYTLSLVNLTSSGPVLAYLERAVYIPRGRRKLMEREAAAKAVAAASVVTASATSKSKSATVVDGFTASRQRADLKRSVLSAELDAGSNGTSSDSREIVPDLYTKLVTHDQCLMLSCLPGNDVSELMRENVLKPFIAKGVLHRWYNGRECLLVCKDTKQVAPTLLLPLLPANTFHLSSLSPALSDIQDHMKGA